MKIMYQVFISSTYGKFDPRCQAVCPAKGM